MIGAYLTTAGLILAVIAVHAGSWWLQRRARRTRQVTITGYLNQPGTRQFTPRHHAASDRMWSEFYEGVRMPGLHMNRRWPQ